MTSEDFCRRHPKLFHVAFAAGWEGILRNGLWSAEELTRLLGWSQEKREGWLSCRRPKFNGFDDVTLGRVTFRDHGAIPKGGLGDALIDVSETQWYRELNRRAYFFVERPAADRLAGAYPGQPQAVFTVDTGRLLESCKGPGRDLDDQYGLRQATAGAAWAGHIRFARRLPARAGATGCRGHGRARD